ncbi:MAG TPA: GDSL-type esterase/lipase family protein [Candidatus Acidoferrales bacterium]|nr:GDSL-type esterase/lipase family protein [Candidatus Acidoferrales bacterium]
MRLAAYGVLAIVLLVVALCKRVGTGSVTERRFAMVPPWQPAPLEGGDTARFRAAHRCFLRAVAKTQPELIFIGDSITAGWLSEGRRVWRRLFESRRPINLGIPGDTTQGVLWRIANGELDGTEPRAIVLLIGTNNIPQPSAPAEIARGIVACVDAIRAKQPACNVVLLGVLPRGLERADPGRAAAAAINARLAQTAFGPSVSYLDMSQLFVQPSGELSKGLYRDGLHLTAAGYAACAPVIDARLRELGV